MQKFTSKLIIAALAGALATGLPVSLLAQDDGSDRKTKQTVAMSQQVYEKLTEIQTAIEDNKEYATAQRLLDELKANEKLSPYERAQVWNLQAYSFYLQERYPDAIRAYDQVMAQPELPEALIQSSLKTKAQLQFTQEDYEGALATVRQLISMLEEPAADVYMLEGQALFQLTRYDDALEPIKRAITMYKEQGQIPKENWLLLLRAIYLEKKDYENMVVVLKELLQHYPKDTYMITYAAVIGELGDTKKQLAIYESLYENGMISDRPSYLTNLANLYLMHQLPYKAAVLLEKEMNAKAIESTDRNLRLLSQAWYSAREDDKAIPPLVQAARMTNDGELYVRIAQANLNLENWGEASAAARKGIQLGGLKRQDTAYLMLGMALLNEKKLEQARDAFAAAGRDNRSERAAQQWIRHVDSEIQRRDLLNQEVEYEEREKDKLLETLEGDQ
jgi:hypothetical protein